MANCAQPRLAVVEQEYTRDLLNTATIVYAAIKANGSDWYTQYVINNLSIGDTHKLRYIISVDSCANMHVFSRMAIPEVIEGLQKAISYINEHQLPFYSCSIGFNILKRTCDSLTRADIVKAIHSTTTGNPSTPFGSIANGWHYSWGNFSKGVYDIYAQKESSYGKQPKSFADWLFEQMKQCLSQPIESSLDYGVTNEDFCSNNYKCP